MRVTPHKQAEKIDRHMDGHTDTQLDRLIDRSRQMDGRTDNWRGRLEDRHINILMKEGRRGGGGGRMRYWLRINPNKMTDGSKTYRALHPPHPHPINPTPDVISMIMTRSAASYMIDIFVAIYLFNFFL